MLALLTAAIENPDDREFMTQFYLEYERLMYATVRKRLTDPEAAKDIVQECVIRLIPKIPFLRRQERCIKAVVIQILDNLRVVVTLENCDHQFVIGHVHIGSTPPATFFAISQAGL